MEKDIVSFHTLIQLTLFTREFSNSIILIILILIFNSFNIVLVFRTVSSNAILLFIQSQDYMALELRNGHLYYSYDLGAGPVFITSNQSLPRFDDDRNHTVSGTYVQFLNYTLL